LTRRKDRILQITFLAQLTACILSSLSLCVEEMAGNIIRHGFSGDGREHMINIRVLKKGEHFIIRIRDDCPIFDPIKQLELYSDEDRTRHIGLRMTAHAAEQFQYTGILKLNNLVIKL
jgi:anti-sigma regulatory factor (Ser/Thr protein kinase)